MAAKGNSQKEIQELITKAFVAAQEPRSGSVEGRLYFLRPYAGELAKILHGIDVRERILRSPEELVVVLLGAALLVQRLHVGKPVTPAEEI